MCISEREVIIVPCLHFSIIERQRRADRGQTPDGGRTDGGQWTDARWPADGIVSAALPFFVRCQSAKIAYIYIHMDHITGLYYGIILRDNITELYYEIILQDHIT